MDYQAIVSQTRTDLEANATQERAEFEKGYMKSELEFLGAKVPAVRKTAKALARQHKDISKKDLLALFKAFWATDVHELRTVGIALLDHFSSLLSASDMPMLRKKIAEAACWAHVDWIAPFVSGSIVIADPRGYDTLDKWASDKNFWVRRAAMLTLLLPLRTGDMKEWPRFVQYAESMLEEKEFFIRKAIGWVLRETSKNKPKPVAEFLIKNKERCSGLTLREGAKYLEPTVRTKLGFS